LFRPSTPLEVVLRPLEVLLVRSALIDTSIFHWFSDRPAAKSQGDQGLLRRSKHRAFARHLPRLIVQPGEAGTQWAHSRALPYKA